MAREQWDRLLKRRENHVTERQYAVLTFLYQFFKDNKIIFKRREFEKGRTKHYIDGIVYRFMDVYHLNDEIMDDINSHLKGWGVRARLNEHNGRSNLIISSLSGGKK